MKTSIKKQLLMWLMPLAGANGCNESKNRSDLTTAANKPVEVSPSNTQLANKGQEEVVGSAKPEIVPGEAAQPPQPNEGLKDQGEASEAPGEANEENDASEGSKESKGRSILRKILRRK